MEIKILASGSDGNAFLVTVGGEKILIECGIPIAALKKALDFKLHEVNFVLLSHEHKDHSHAVKDLIKLGKTVITSKPTAEHLGLSGVKVVEQLEPIRVTENIRITPFAVFHDVDNFGYIIDDLAKKEKLLFFTDTKYVTYLVPGVTHLLCECNHSHEEILRRVKNGDLNETLAKRIINNHLDIDTFKEVLRVNKWKNLQEIHLIHLSSGNSDAAAFKREIQALTGVPVYL